MSAKPQLTSANGTPEEPLPESPVLTAREDDIPLRVRRVIWSFADHEPEVMEPCS